MRSWARAWPILVSVSILWATLTWGAIASDALQQLARDAGMRDDAILVITPVQRPMFITGVFEAPDVMQCKDRPCEVCPVECPPARIKIWYNERVPDVIVQYVMLHELGHYFQWRADSLAFEQRLQTERVIMEQQADAFAVEWECQHGMDGRQAMRDGFQWMREKFGYRGDPEHGTPEARIDYVMEHSPSCQN